jgi:hypothetical protein
MSNVIESRRKWALCIELRSLLFHLVWYMHIYTNKSKKDVLKNILSGLIKHSHCFAGTVLWFVIQQLSKVSQSTDKGT